MLLGAASFAPIALGAASGTLIWLVLFAFTSIAAITAYALLTQLVPAAQTGRVTTSSNVLLFATSFGFQWGVGGLLGLWPSSDGRYQPEAYRAAFGLPLAAQAAAALWLLTARQEKS